MRAAHRRLRAEFGFDCELKEAFSFIYSAELGGGMVEREFDHVFIGRFSGRPEPDPEEISDYRWIPLARLYRELRLDDDSYAAWFKILLVQLAIHRGLAAGLIPAHPSVTGR